MKQRSIRITAFRSTAQLWIAGIGGDRRLSRQNGDLKSRKIPLLVATKGNRQNAIRIAFALLPRVGKHRRTRTIYGKARHCKGEPMASPPRGTVAIGQQGAFYIRRLD